MIGPGDLYTGPDVECDCGVDWCDCIEDEMVAHVEWAAEDARASLDDYDRVMFP